MSDQVLFDAEDLFDNKPKEEEDTESVSSVSYRKLPSCSLDSLSMDEDLQEVEIHYRLQKEKVRLPAMELFIQNLGIIQDRNSLKKTKKPAPVQERPLSQHDIDYSMETPIDVSVYTSSLASIVSQVANVTPNLLNPREQEASGLMTFIKAITTKSKDDIELAYNTLTVVINMANAQISCSSKKNLPTSSWSLYFSSLIALHQTGLPAHGSVHQKSSTGDPPVFMPNGLLRANAIKADCYLIIALLQLSQEIAERSMKCTQNIKKGRVVHSVQETELTEKERLAFKYYSIVWQEHKRMGQDYTKYMDRDTVSAVQFGMGSVHLLVSVLLHNPSKATSLFGFKCDLQLGLALLKLCVQGKGMRSPLASLMLLAYYSTLSAFVPQIYAKESKTRSMECLLDAQKAYPSSCFFLYYAAQISRSSKELALSTQSFTFAIDATRGEWMEDAMTHIGVYEIGFNSFLQMDWSSALVSFEKLSQNDNQKMTAFYYYLVGSCRAMLGQQTESILAFAQVPQLVKEQYPNQSSLCNYVKQKVEFFQKSGYQDLSFSLPALELLLVWNAFDQMETTKLEKCLSAVQHTLDLIYQKERLEYTVRLHELLPLTEPPNLYEQRAIVLLIRAAVLNALGRFAESISHLNWIMDHQHQLVSETWVTPFTLWEAGITGWGMNDPSKSRTFWEKATTFSNYAFEDRMNVRLSLALNRCNQLGATVVKKKKEKGLSTNGQKRMPIVSLTESFIG
ncbi:Tetratricopeptide repeat protein 39C [Choanephora cucurbitarum]|uniref:Tetratricopeptide repeat protein 39C n=1 Tax=Choanephora cucurbitarum TaxID=101091 RepID=A0A1C7NAU6_9FUNG|nr:Tetratricopeptide repeat protein 39C [Choanephora cucurbitarum]